MALVINTNIASLNSQRQLVSSGNDLNQATERLASGKRINSAKDDAAGLAISNRMTSQIRGLNQAVRNANDGVSLIQTAEGALQETTNILQRMRELAIQSGNGIYTDADRQTLDAEVQQLVSELNRISETTSFNGQKLLDGSLGDVDLQIGSEANETITFSITAMDADTLGLGSTSSDIAGSRVADLTALNATDNTAASFGDGDILINGQSLGAFDGTVNNLQDVIDDINENIDGVSASGFNIVQAGAVGTGQMGSDDTLTISVFNVDDGSQTDFTFQNTQSMDDLVEQINSKAGGLITASTDESGRMVLSNDTGSALGLTYDNNGTGTDNLDTIIGLTANDVLNQAGSNPTNTQEFITGSGAPNMDTALLTGALSLTSDDGEEISITNGAAGTPADLASLGLQSLSDGFLKGQSLESAAQTTALNAGDLTINGVGIEATTAAEGLLGKVDNINDVSQETGVVASIKAQQSYAYDSTVTPVEATGSLAFASPATAFQELHFANGVAPAFGATDFSGGESFTVDVTDMAGTTTVVTIDGNPINSTAALLGDINDELAANNAEAYIDNNGLLAFRDTVGGGGNVTVALNTGGTTPGVANTLLGFDIEGLSSAGTFTGAGPAFELNGVNIDLTAAQADGAISASEVAGAVNSAASSTGVRAYVDANDILHLSSETAFTLADDANASGFVSNLNIPAGTYTANTIPSAAPPSFAATDFTAGSNTNFAFDVRDEAGTTTNVTVDATITNSTELLTAINEDLVAGGNNVTAYLNDSGSLAFRDTVGGSNAVTLGGYTEGGGNPDASALFGFDIEAATAANAISLPNTALGSIVINGFEISDVSLTDFDAAVATINSQQANTGVVAAVDDNGQLQFTANASITLDVGDNNGLALGAVLGIDFVDTVDTLGNPGADGVVDTQTVNAGIELRSINEAQPISVEVTANGATATGLQDLNTDLSAIITGSALSNVSIATQAGAQAAIGSIDNALETINAVRSELGAANNRLDFTMSNLSNVAEKTSAARSRIVDADFAAETAQLSRAQVLQSASQAMLAQSNARPQEVLQLLQ